MIFETDLFVRDTLRINILKELMAGNISLAVRLDNGAMESYATQIHSDMGRVKVYGNFNMSESVDGEVLTIRPISVDRVMKAVPAMAGGISGKEIALVRSSTKKIENTYPFDETFMGLELVPSENKYILRLEYADSIQTEQPVIQEEISVVQEEQPVVQEPVKDEKVQKIEEELKKDYTAAQTQLDECKTQLEIDKRVLEYYKDKDVKPIEEIFKEIQQKFDEAEKQIALFIQAQQKKTMEIEGS